MRWRSNRWLWGGAAALLVGTGLAAVGWWTKQHWGIGLLHADSPLPPSEPTVYFDSDSYTVTEDGTVTNTVLLSSAAQEAVTVNLELLNEYGYVLESWPITLWPGETTYSHAYTALDDTCPNPDVMLTLRLVNPQGGNTSLGAPSTATLTIMDNDQPIAINDSAYALEMLCLANCQNGRKATRCKAADEGIGCSGETGDKNCDIMNPNCKCYEHRRGCICAIARQ